MVKVQVCAGKLVLFNINRDENVNCDVKAVIVDIRRYFNDHYHMDV